MRLRSLLSVALLSSLAGAPAHASFGGGSKPEPPETARPPEASATTQTTPRQEAERYYGDAYGDVAKAKKDLADGKTRNAEKRFKRALERGERAVELDSTYHEALNLVGFSARQLRQYEKSLAAYARCLRIKPDYAPAREYLGEAYVDLGQPEKAREQLAWLERLEAADEAANLKARIDAWAAAHPESPTPGAAARPDSATGSAAIRDTSFVPGARAPADSSSASTRSVARPDSAAAPPASKP